MNVSAIALPEERRIELREQVKGWRDAKVVETSEADALAAELKPRVRVAHLAARLTSFVLALFLVAATFGFLELLSLPKGWITAILAVGTAELLVRKKNFLRTGIEEGLYLGGLYAFIFGLPGEGKPEALILFVIATLIPALRLRQALFFVLSFGLAVGYVAWRMDESGAGESAIAWVVAAICLVASILALQFLRADRESPAAELALSIVVALTPAAAYVATMIASEERTPLAFSALMLLYVVLLVFTGIRFALHAPIVGALLLAVVIGVDLADRIDLAAEWKLIAAGFGVLAAGLVVERRLRGRNEGLTSDALVELRETELVEIAAAAALAAHGRHDASAAPQGGPAVQPSDDGADSSFGGGGASENF